MNSFSRTPTFNSFNSPKDKSTKRFTRMKQNIDIYNIRASNYKSALERTFERASQIEDYNFYGSIYQDFSSPKFATSSSSFFSSNQPSLSSYSRNSALRHNSNSSIKPCKNKFTTTPSSLFNEKWDSNIDNNNCFHQSHTYYNYDDIDKNDFKPEITQDRQNSFSNPKNNLPKKQEEKKIPKKEKEIILTPNRVKSNKKKFIQENQDHSKEFDIDLEDHIKNDTIYEAFNEEVKIEVDSTNQKKNDALDEKFEEEEEASINSKGHTEKKFMPLIEEEETNERQNINSNISNSKEMHSQAYLNAMNSVNSRMKQFNSKINHHTATKSQKTKNKNEIDYSSKKDNLKTNDVKQKENEDSTNKQIIKKNEDEFKKKQRVELEEIKSLYALLEKELKQIQKESNNSNSISEIDNENGDENDGLSLKCLNEDLKEMVEQDSNPSS